MTDDSGRVRRRKVFYIPGFDPIGPRRYRELYRRESAKQGAVSGYDIRMEAALDLGPHAWRARIGEVEAEIEVLAWHDIVRGEMGQPLWAVYRLLARTLWLYLRSGALFAVARLRKGPLILALYPVVILSGYALASVALFLIGYLALSTFNVPVALAFACGAVFGGGWWFFVRRVDHGIWGIYLMEDFGHVASADGAWPAALDARIDDFAKRIREARALGVDEVLVVGHSSGAQIAVSAVARARGQGAALALLTVGQSIPMTSFLPGAATLRADLAALGAAWDVTWVDVSAPSDGATFALADPVAVSGVAGPETRQPLVISAAFNQTLSEETRRWLRWRFFTKHVQYLRAFDGPDRPKDAYDYFQITAGDRTLKARYAGRRSSPSRIARAVSPHRSMS